MNYDCLIIEDERMLSDSVAEYFDVFDISAECAYSYDEAVEKLGINTYKLALLDINLGERSGYELCRIIRKMYADMTICFISARSSDADMLKAYGLGGDDYVIKPFSLPVLVAKVKALLTRNKINSGLVIDEKGMEVSVNGKTVELKPMEYALLKYLNENKGRVCGKAEIADNVWGGGYVTDNSLNVHINRLREKLGEEENSPKIITVWGIGYKML